MFRHVAGQRKLSALIAIAAFLIAVGPAAGDGAGPHGSAYTPDAVTETSATLRGVVYDNSPGQPPVTYHFEYGTTTAYGTSTPEQTTPGGLDCACNVSYAISGLTPGTTYHFRVVTPGPASSDVAFTTKSTPVDTDGDGYFDGEDPCPTESGGAAGPTNQAGCPLPPPPPPPPPPSYFASAKTGAPTQVTDSGATLNGMVGGNEGDVTYHFEYGATEAYGKQTPETQAPGPFDPFSHETKVSQKVELPEGREFHFRIVATDTQMGTKPTGYDSSGFTVGPSPAGPGTTRIRKTLNAGGVISTGSNPSKSNPIVVSVKVEKGGDLTVDEIAKPDRPGDDVSCDESNGAEGCVEDNPEDQTPKGKYWYGPAIRIFAPDAGGGKAPRQVITVVFRIDGATDMRETPHPEAQLAIDGFDGSHYGACFPGKVGSARHLPGGDTEITNYFKCNADDPLTFQFFNPGWGGIGRESFGTYAQSLNDELDNGRLSFGFQCNLKCSKTITASIAKKSAKALGLKSNVIGSVHTEPGEDYNGVPFNPKAFKALKKITRKGGRLTVLFEAKAVGPDGQVVKKHQTNRLKADAEENDF